jgi:hypothetical protein
MGYFDALVRNLFMTAPDGRRVFFPWGVVGRAYVIGSESDYERLRRQIKISLIVAPVLVIISGLALSRSLFGLAAVALIALIVAWMLYLLRDLASPAERLSLQEPVTLQARGRSPESLRRGIIGSLRSWPLASSFSRLTPQAIGP